MKGEGDGERNKIFANAFGRDPQFFAFYRAMQAYEKALIGGETSLVLSPDMNSLNSLVNQLSQIVKDKLSTIERDNYSNRFIIFY